MTETRLRLEYEEGAAPYPGRHAVLPAVLARDGERIPVVVKRVPVDWRQRLKGTTKAETAHEIARALAERGIDTPEPLGIEVREGESLLVTRRLPDAAQIREWFLFRDDPTRFPRPSLPIPLGEVIAALGRLARRLHDQGVFYRDLTDGNVLVTGRDGRPRLWLVDVDRARVRGRPLGLVDRLRDLCRPGLNRAEDRRLLLQSYLAVDRPSPLFLGLLALFRGRLVLWDDLKRRARPWRRRS